MKFYIKLLGQEEPFAVNIDDEDAKGIDLMIKIRQALSETAGEPQPMPLLIFAGKRIKSHELLYQTSAYKENSATDPISCVLHKIDDDYDLEQRFHAALMSNPSDWGNLTELLSKAPSLANSIVQAPGGPTPRPIFYIASACDESVECKNFLEKLMNNVDWAIRDEVFDNTPLLWAISTNNRHIIKPMIDFIKEKEALLPHLSSFNSQFNQDSCNTPLLLALKNGDTETALSLLDYYDKDSLLHLTANVNSALHLASFCGFNDVIKAIIARADQLGCKGDLLEQRNGRQQTAASLYAIHLEQQTSSSERISGSDSGYPRMSIFTSGSMGPPEYNWREYIGNAHEELGKHDFMKKLSSGFQKCIDEEVLSLFQSSQMNPRS